MSLLSPRVKTNKQTKPLTFKETEEESLSVCDLNDLLLIWCCFILHFLLMVFVQEI